MPRSEEAPRGFRLLTRDRLILVVAARLEETARSLFLRDPGELARYFAAGGGALGRAETALVEIPGATEKLVLRRLLHGGLLGPLLRERFFGVGRPLRELRVTATLRDAGAPVPRPALVLGWRLAGPFWTAVVGSYLEPNTVDGLNFLGSRPEPTRLLRAAAAAGSAVRRFHDEGGRHADLHVKNLLIRERDGCTECIVIDLDKARITPGMSPAERMAQIMRLFRSLLKREVLETVGTRGCASFFGSYCAGDRPLRRALWRRVDRELRMVAIHKLGYRADG